MEIHPTEIVVYGLVEIVFRFHEKRWSNGFDFDGETTVDIQSLTEPILLHSIKIPFAGSPPI